jgi:hypothetical protein
MMGDLVANGQNGDADTLKVEDMSIFGGGSAEIHPIIFEECYVKDSDHKFVSLVKANPDVLTEEALLSFDPLSAKAGN